MVYTVAMLLQLSQLHLFPLQNYNKTIVISVPHASLFGHHILGGINQSCGTKQSIVTFCSRKEILGFNGETCRIQKIEIIHFYSHLTCIATKHCLKHSYLVRVIRKNTIETCVFAAAMIYATVQYSIAEMLLIKLLQFKL